MDIKNLSTKTGHIFGKKFGRKLVFCLLSVAIMFALNIAYSTAGSEKKLLLQKEVEAGVGVVKGILHNENNPTALIGTELAHEGDVISGATVLKIHKDSVDFEKDGFSWTKRVMEKSE